MGDPSSRDSGSAPYWDQRDADGQNGLVIAGPAFAQVGVRSKAKRKLLEPGAALFDNRLKLVLYSPK